MYSYYIRTSTGADLGFQKGGANMDILVCGKKVNTTSVRSTLSMRSMLYLGGLGACPHRKLLQIWPIEIEFGSNFEWK